MARRKAETAPEGTAGKIQVWNAGTDVIEWVTPQEAAAGIVAFGRQAYGEGSPGFAVVVEKAVTLLAEHGYTPAGRRL